MVYHIPIFSKPYTNFWYTIYQFFSILCICCLIFRKILCLENLMYEKCKSTRSHARYCTGWPGVIETKENVEMFIPLLSIFLRNFAKFVQKKGSIEFSLQSSNFMELKGVISSYLCFKTKKKI